MTFEEFRKAGGLRVVIGAALGYACYQETGPWTTALAVFLMLWLELVTEHLSKMCELLSSHGKMVDAYTKGKSDEAQQPR